MAGTPDSVEKEKFTLSPELRRISTIVVLGSIMSILDTTIVAVALPTLAKDFHVPVTTIQWVVTGYLLALALVTPVTGWAVDRFGAKAVWMTSTALFILGSSLCGLAWSANSLIFFRVLQGIGGGMLLPVGQSLLARAAGPQRMGRVMSIIGVPMVMGPIMGPVIGGLIVSNYSWRWIFYINVPIGLVTLVLSSRWLPKFDTEERYPSAFDTLGFCLLSPGLAALLYSLSEVGTTGSLSSPSVVVSFVLGIALMLGFVLARPTREVPALGAAPLQAPQLRHRQRLHLRHRSHALRLHVPAAHLLPGGPRPGSLAGRAPHGAPGHRRRVHHALGRQRDGPARAPPRGARRHPRSWRRPPSRSASSPLRPAWCSSPSPSSCAASASACP